ncbi:MAG TPA: HAMP domain-containing sensor histidine kinase [Candidatus Limnocylindrales bacterium]|nr:HAMP domain-containing sensor histidine kinase [Candidatus Limnocylindrales bacterium]
MGRRISAGAGGDLTLRLRLIAAAAGIVAVSLLLAGALTWVMVRDLEYQSVQDQLDRQVTAAAAQVRTQECLTPNVTGTAVCRPDSPADFTDRLNNKTSGLGSERLILLDSSRYVVYDSGDGGTIGSRIVLTQSRRFTGVSEARTPLGAQNYLAAAIKLPGKRVDPLGAAWVMLAQPEALVATAAAGVLATRLLEAGGAALVLAILLALLVSRSMTRPLTQLAFAAEDIAAGNYSRRVSIKGQDEIGLLGSAFNRMAEAVERARKVQRDFLANVSHELKTPLTSLIGFSQALVDGSLLSDAERTRAATIVHEESERVLRMAQELLDLARVEAGSISMHITAVDMGGQLEQEHEMVRPRADARKLVLKLNVPDDIPPVAADPERLHQILDNLLDNAVKYAAEGSTVTTAARLSGGSVETIVANPTGVHRPDPDRMFDRFYRADPSRSAAAGGVGLGLSISRELAGAMKGRLWADFDEAGNLRLHLTLPASRATEKKAEPVTPAAVA